MLPTPAVLVVTVLLMAFALVGAPALSLTLPLAALRPGCAIEDGDFVGGVIH